MLQTQQETVSDFLNWWLSNERLRAENQAVFSRYYKSFARNFGTYLRYHYNNQIREVEHLVRLSGSPPRLLEIGCGCGTEALWFAMKGCSVLAIDIAQSRLSVAEERKQILSSCYGKEIDAEFRFASFFDLEIALGSIDIIWMEQAFHHIEPRDALPQRLFEVLKPGGHIVLSEANGWNPLLQLALLRKRGFRTIRQYKDRHGKEHAYGDERVTVPCLLSRLFLKNGFELVDKRYFRVFPNFKHVDKYGFVENLVPQFLPPPFTHYNMVLRKPLHKS